MLRYALLWSILVHAVLLPLLLWLAAVQLFKSLQEPESQIVSSTSIRLERRAVPQPRSVPQRSVPRAVAQPALRRPELSKTAPTAPPQRDATPSPAPQPTAARERTLQQQLDAQQQQYTREVARLNAADNPHSVATMPPSTPSAKRMGYFDESGHRDVFLSGHGFLEPVRSWQPDAGHTCYYVQYSFEYAGGGSEDGTVPWPICYAKTNDEFKKPPHDMDLPTPQPGFTTTQFLTPLLKYYYNRKQGAPPNG